MADELKIIGLLAIGLGLACICGYIAQRIKQSPIIGYLFAGYLIGPASPGFVADASIAEQLASIGVTLLMFVVGLSFNWKDLKEVKNIALPGALTLSGICILAGTLYSYYLGEPLLSGFVIGIAICVSSTVVIVRVLSDRGLLHTKQGHLAVGWTIVEDMISVFGLLLLPPLAIASANPAESVNTVVFEIVILLLKIGALALTVNLFGEKLIEHILKTVARTRSHELFTLAILSTTFVIAIGSSYLFGVSLAMGAFIAGVIIGKTDLSSQAAANALPMRDAFAVIFFLSVGMLFNPVTLINNLPLFLGILFILLILRPVVAFLLVKMAGYPSTVAMTVAMAIAQIGEYSFILAEEGSALKILPDNAYDILVAGAFLTITLNPLLFEIFQIKITTREKRYSDLPEELVVKQLTEPSPPPLSKGPRAIVIGFGPIGQTAVKEVLKRGYRITVLDQNIDAIVALKGTQIETIFGDATQFYILEKTQPENASLLIITTPEFSVTQAIIQMAQDMNPHLKIIARSRYKAILSNHALDRVTIFCDEDTSSEKLVAILHAELDKQEEQTV